MNVTSKTLLSHMEEQRLDQVPSSFKEKSISILSILEELNSKAIIGNAKLDKLSSFMLYLKSVEGIVKDDQLRQKATLQDVFLRCLDRNFRAGISLHTIQEVYSKNKPLKKALPKLPGHLRKGVLQQKRFDEVMGSAEGHISADEGDNVMEEMTDQAGIGRDPIDADRAKEDDDIKGVTASHWDITLGKSSNLEQLESLIGEGRTNAEESVDSWYLSRKLDGVRCIIRIDFEGETIPLTVTKIETLSRTGRPFTSLGVLTDNLASLASTSQTIMDILKRTPTRPDGQRRRSVYIDGELCALLPQKEGVDGYMEDFNEIVGLVRRQDYTVQNPAYFPFDILTHVEFENWKNHQEAPDQHQPFYLRKKRVEQFLRECQDKGSINVKILEQHHITSSDQIKKAAEEAASKGWEGLIMRKGDLYQGKRR